MNMQNTLDDMYKTKMVDVKRKQFYAHYLKYIYVN